jgi:hypothetical protein
MTDNQEMQRLSTFITKEQHEYLRIRSFRENRTIADILRDIIQQVIMLDTNRP